MRTQAERMQVLMDLLKRKEVHECDKCGESHEIELGVLEEQDIKALLEAENEQD